MLWLCILLAALAALYLFSIRPNSGRQGQMEPFVQNYIAHRGLHDNPAVPENSLAAFRRAVEAGYGIELDIQLTADDRLVVFHDETLARVCGDPRKLHECTWEELKRLRLFGTEEGIPLLEDVLACIGGRVPLVAEIKSEGRWRRTTELACAMLRAYGGTYCVESFHPLVLRWLLQNAPEILRGQLSTNFFREPNEQSAPARLLLTNLMLDFLAKPDFIAYDRRYLRGFSFRLCSRLYRPVNAAWTVRSPEELREAESVYQVFIFEGFRPEELERETECAT